MTFLRLGLWLFRRERSSGEWRVLLLALIIGVGSVSTTGFLGDRIKRAMSEQGAGFLGADLLVTSPRPVECRPATLTPCALSSISSQLFWLPSNRTSCLPWLRPPDPWAHVRRSTTARVAANVGMSPTPGNATKA